MKDRIGPSRLLKQVFTRFYLEGGKRGSCIYHISRLLASKFLYLGVGQFLL